VFHYTIEIFTAKRIRREIKVWKRLEHNNILPLYGTASDFGPYTSFVCPWMENGNLTQYLGRYGDKLKLSERFRILNEVATGLSYLHSFFVIHGDLTGSNVLIDKDGKSYVSDFGMSDIVAEFQGTSYAMSCMRGSVRWAAPELYRLQEPNVSPPASTHSDIYSFGCVMFQVLSGQFPYYDIKQDSHVVILLHQGVKPLRPTEAPIDDKYWGFIQRCWADPNFGDRPTIAEACECLQQYHRENSDLFPVPTLGQPIMQLRDSDSRMALNNFLQSRYGGTRGLTWSINPDGPNGALMWTVIGYLDGVEYGRASATRKATAMNSTAGQMLFNLQGHS